jgi:hypothetical protein
MKTKMIKVYIHNVSQSRVYTLTFARMNETVSRGDKFKKTVMDVYEIVNNKSYKEKSTSLETYFRQYCTLIHTHSREDV